MGLENWHFERPEDPTIEEVDNIMDVLKCNIEDACCGDDLVIWRRDLRYAKALRRILGGEWAKR